VNERIEQFLAACEDDANAHIAYPGPRLRAMTGNH